MARQTFTAAQILTAAQMTSLQSNDFNQTVSTKTASYTLVAADAGTRVVMNSASATTITVNTSLFAAGDTLTLLNIGAGVCTVTAGTATVSSAGTKFMLANSGGTLLFVSASASIWFPSAINKVLQVVQGSNNTGIASSSATYVDTGLTVSITPSSASSKVLVFAAHTVYTNASTTSCALRIVRDSTTLTQSVDQMYTPSGGGVIGTWSLMTLDSPATTSATTYKTTFARNSGAGTATLNSGSNDAKIIVMEVSA